MGIGEVVGSKRDAVVALAREHGATNVRIFGSLARGEADAASDVDVLVDLDYGRSLFDLGALAMSLEGLLGRRVDVVTEKGLKARIRDRVLRESVQV